MNIKQYYKNILKENLYRTINEVNIETAPPEIAASMFERGAKAWASTAGDAAKYPTSPDAAARQRKAATIFAKVGGRGMMVGGVPHVELPRSASHGEYEAPSIPVSQLGGHLASLKSKGTGSMLVGTAVVPRAGRIKAAGIARARRMRDIGIRQSTPK